MSIQRRGPSCPACPLWKGAAYDEFTHDAVVNIQFTRDSLHRAALGVQHHHHFILGHPKGAAVVAQTLPCDKSTVPLSPLLSQRCFIDDNLLGCLRICGPSR